MRIGAKSAVFTLVVAIAAGCAATKTDPKSGNGVDDVATACELRTKWNRTGNDCSLCEAAAIDPHCDCSSLDAFSGACLDQQNARKGVCPDTVDNCIFACDRDDCACVEKCYVAGDACKKASDARDGCIVEACADHCK